MTSDPPLRPATAQELEETLSHALRFSGRKRTHTGDEFMANLTAQRLIEHLERSGYVVMKRPVVREHSSPDPAAGSRQRSPE